MAKIDLNDSIMDIVMKMAEGNPGALTFIMELMKHQQSAGIDGMVLLLHLDDIGLYGSPLYMLWNDCCDRDLGKVEVVMRNYQFGKLTKDQILKQVSGGRGRPFENLTPVEELLSQI